MTSLASREMTEQEMINTCTAPQMAHLIQVLRQTIRNKEKEIQKWVDMVNQLQRDDELDPPEPKPEPEKESPIDPIERPLRSLILRAKEEGKNIRTYYQDMVFTPCALDGLLADGKFRWWNISNWELTNREQNYYPQLYEIDEPNPEPAYKVGDWVEIEVSGVISQQLVKLGVFADSIIAGGIEFYGNGLPVMKPLNARIIRKLDPSEVIVKIGCLEGTVERAGDDRMFLVSGDGHTNACIMLAMLDTPTRELVKALLKAQEEK